MLKDSPDPRTVRDVLNKVVNEQDKDYALRQVFALAQQSSPEIRALIPTPAKASEQELTEDVDYAEEESQNDQDGVSLFMRTRLI